MGQFPLREARIRRRFRVLIASLALIFSIPASQSANAANPQIMTTAAVCTGAWGTGSNAWAGPATKIYAPRGATITSATVPYANTSTKTTARLSIYNNSGSLPGALIGYLSFSSEASNVATFTGSAIVLPSAGYYWVQLGATSSQMNCYTSSANYTGSNAGWLSYAGIAYGSSGSGYTPTAWAAFGSPQNAYQINFSLFGTESGVGSVSLNQTPTVATFRIATTVSAAFTGTGKATFYQNSKVISGCRSLNVDSSTVNCIWSPTIKGSVQIYVLYTPTGGSAIKSNSSQISVNPRQTLR